MLCVYNDVCSQIKQIFELLTSEFSPLELCAKIAPLLANLKESVHTTSPSSPVKTVDLSMYIPQLKQVSHAHSERGTHRRFTEATLRSLYSANRWTRQMPRIRRAR